MTQLLEENNTHLVNFSRFEKQEGFGGPAWLSKLRRNAIARFEEVGFPSAKEEEWRFTQLAPIIKTPFRLAGADASAAAAEAVQRFSFAKDAACELVFVNGRFAPSLCTLGSLPRGVRVENLREAAERIPDLVERHLGKYAGITKNPFVALNTAFAGDGALVHVARNVIVEGPIHVLHVSTAGVEPAVSHPRLLLVVEDNAEVPLVETYAGTGGVYFTNAVSEIVAAPGARIDHCRLQQESLEAYHLGTMQVRLDRSANVVSHSATLGGRITRNDLNVILDGEAADATLNGLVVIGGEQHVDNHTLLQHEKAHCPSHELYKHVLDGKASAVFKGKIFVQKDAQKTDSKQTSKSLLLSDDATMNSQPALEIYADDVKCTHGSTTGPVDEEMVFYLRSRGVGLDAARHLLTYAFAADITRRIRIAPVRARLEDFMAAQHGLPQDLRITDLGAHDEAAL